MLSIFSYNGIKVNVSQVVEDTYLGDTGHTSSSQQSITFSLIYLYSLIEQSLVAKCLKHEAYNFNGLDSWLSGLWRVIVEACAINNSLDNNVDNGIHINYVPY